MVSFNKLKTILEGFESNHRHMSYHLHSKFGVGPLKATKDQIDAAYDHVVKTHGKEHADQEKQFLTAHLKRQQKPLQEAGAGFDGTSELVKNYKKATPGEEKKTEVITNENDSVEEIKIVTESAPPDPKIEKWIKSNKESFTNRYGKEKGTRLLYATAWNMHRNNKGKPILK